MHSILNTYTRCSSIDSYLPPIAKAEEKDPADAAAPTDDNKLFESRDLGDGKTERTYTTGIKEIYDQTGQGYRLLPNGTKERGTFNHAQDTFICAYRIDAEGNPSFVSPSTLLEYQKISVKKYEYIVEFEGELIVIEQTYTARKNPLIKGNASVEDFLSEWMSQGRQSCTILDAEAFRRVLTHSGFSHKLPDFIKKILTPDEPGTPQLLSVNERVAAEIIEVVVQLGYAHPLQIMDASKTNLFIHAAQLKQILLLEKLTIFFPDIFQSIAFDVIDILVAQGVPLFHVQNFIEQIKKEPVYYALYLQIAERRRPDEKFYAEFSELSTDHQKLLYQAAFSYNNPFFHEPADVPITPQQYSINFMWINKQKISPHQEFLFGDGFTPEAQALDFQRCFVQPISQWAQANPESAINIWVDREMATPKAIQNSLEALQAALKDTIHGEIQFRDVRSIKVVDLFPDAFCARLPVYFRADLLRAAAADHALRKKETQFFVYADLDVGPLSTKELFDQKTIHFLNDVGFVMAKGGSLGFENSFQILNGHHRQFMKSHRKVIIDLSIEMAVERPNAIGEQQIYDTYPAMMTHFFAAEGRYGKLMLPGEDIEAIEDSSCFRRDQFGVTAHMELPLEQKRVQLREIMPRKPVDVPPSHFSSLAH